MESEGGHLRAVTFGAICHSLISMAVLLRWKVGILWQTQLETKLQVCLSILHREIESGFARCSGPDFGNFSKTVEEEGFLCQVERCVVHLAVVAHFWTIIFMMIIVDSELEITLLFRENQLTRLVSSDF